MFLTRLGHLCWPRISTCGPQDSSGWYHCYFQDRQWKSYHPLCVGGTGRMAQGSFACRPGLQGTFPVRGQEYFPGHAGFCQRWIFGCFSLGKVHDKGMPSIFFFLFLDPVLPIRNQLRNWSENHYPAVLHFLAIGCVNKRRELFRYFVRKLGCCLCHHPISVVPLTHGQQTNRKIIVLCIKHRAQEIYFPCFFFNLAIP